MLKFEKTEIKKNGKLIKVFTVDNGRVKFTFSTEREAIEKLKSIEKESLLEIEKEVKNKLKIKESIELIAFASSIEKVMEERNISLNCNHGSGTFEM